MTKQRLTFLPFPELAVDVASAEQGHDQETEDSKEHADQRAH